MEYLRVFDTEADYESVKDSLVYPTISYTVDTDKVWYAVDINGTPSLYEWVDLGLPSGLKWAAWNVGATKPEEFGLYFAWGETQGYTGITDTKRFTWGDYTLCDGTKNNMTKYNATDGLTALEAADDAATVTDNSCRMPTKEDVKELTANTTSAWTQVNGVSGVSLTSNVNSNSIFVPAAGNCFDGSVKSVGQSIYLWSSSLSSTGSRGGAYSLFFNSGSVLVYGSNRNSGISVRAVKE